MNKKVWLVRLTNHGFYDVVPGQVQERDADGMVFVKIPCENHDGKRDTIVVECEPHKVFTSKKEALLLAAEKSRASADCWLKNAFNLLTRASETKE